MKKYIATLQYSRYYTIEVEGDDIHHARRIAERYAELEDVDINNHEFVIVTGVERVEDVE